MGRVGMEVYMTHTPDPYAMVLPASSAQKGLKALGWTVMDTAEGLLYMEPPLGEEDYEARVAKANEILAICMQMTKSWEKIKEMSVELMPLSLASLKHIRRLSSDGCV